MTRRQISKPVRLFIFIFHPPFLRLASGHLISAACFQTVAADSVEHRPCRIQLKTMGCKHVLLQMDYLVTFQMYQFAALLAFEMKARRPASLFPGSDIFKACAVRWI